MNQDVITATINAAKAHSIETAAALAILDVESAGVAFWNVNGTMLPPIRFEGHYFYARLNEQDRAKAVAQGLASPKAGGVPNPTSFAARYSLLERAKAISATAALESTSWGLGQVMGANWQALGFASVDELVKSANTVDGQVEMVFKYIDVNGLTDEINNHDWSGFKNGYNGKKANGYDTKIANAYLKYSGQIVAPKNDEIYQLQKMLNTLGDYKLTVDGDYDDATKAALRDFQLKNGLTVDGLYGPISKDAIEKAYLAKSAKSTTNTGVGGLSVGTAGTALSEAGKQIQGFADTSQIIQYVFVGLIVLGALVSVYGVWKAMRNK
jgi:hypothetical protein